MDAGIETSDWDLTARILAINFAAQHTSSMAFNHTLYHLAAMPQHLQPMRDEVDEIVGKDGWSKASMAKLHKVDSFLKESMVSFTRP